MASQLSVMTDQLVQYWPKDLSCWQSTALATVLAAGALSVLCKSLELLRILLNIFILPGKSVRVHTLSEEFVEMLVELELTRFFL